MLLISSLLQTICIGVNFLLHFSAVGRKVGNRNVIQIGDICAYMHSLLNYSKHSFILRELNAYLKCVSHDIKIKT